MHLITKYYDSKETVGIGWAGLMTSWRSGNWTLFPKTHHTRKRKQFHGFYFFGRWIWNVHDFEVEIHFEKSACLQKSFSHLKASMKRDNVTLTEFWAYTDSSGAENRNYHMLQKITTFGVPTITNWTIWSSGSINVTQFLILWFSSTTNPAITNGSLIRLEECGRRNSGRRLKPLSWWTQFMMQIQFRK